MENKKIALVTGATRGIGKAIALGLSDSGYYIIGTATTDAGAMSISGMFAENQSGEGRVLDVSDSGQVESTLKQVVSEKGPISILVNNAGITRDNIILRMKESEWDEVYEANLKGIFRVTKQCLRRGMLKQRWGRIINISSVVGVTGNPGQSNYAAMKAALAGFSKSVAQEVASCGITVNCIAPGFIETRMTAALSEQVKHDLLARIPMNKLGQPEDIASAVVFLASESAQYITGQTIHINGGMLMV